MNGHKVCTLGLVLSPNYIRNDLLHFSMQNQPACERTVYLSIQSGLMIAN